MGYGLTLWCEKCSTWTEQHVTDSDPSLWHLESDRRDGLDIKYRTRIRTCPRCGRSQSTMEAPRWMVTRLLDEIDRLKDLVGDDTEVDGVEPSAYFPACTRLLFEIFGASHRAPGPAENLTTVEVAEMVKTVMAALDTLALTEATAVSVYHDFPGSSGRVDKRKYSNAMSKLRHPSRSKVLQPWLERLDPTASGD